MGLQILASDKIVRINDDLMLGQVQNFDWAPAFNSEDIFELGLETRIATSLELETSGSFEILSIGGTAGVLARMIVRRTAGTGAFEGYLFREPEAPQGVAQAGGTTTTLVTLESWTVNEWAGYEVDITAGAGSGESSVIVSNTATDLTFAPALTVATDATTVHVISKGNNFYTLTEASIREVIFDIGSHERADSTSFDRTTVLPRQFLSAFSGRADAAGTASETFNFTGDFVFAAPAPYHDMRMVPAIFSTASEAILVDTTIDGSTDSDIAYCYFDEIRLDTDSTKTQYVALGLGGVITVSGLVVTNQQRIQAQVFIDAGGTPSTTFPALVAKERATNAFFVKGYQCNIYIAPATPSAPTSSEQWLRVQSVDWNVDLRVERLRQIAYNEGGSSVYAILPTFPFNITANATVFETDLADWKAVLDPVDKPFGGTGTDFVGESYDFAPSHLKNAFAIVVEYRTLDNVLLQTWRFTDMAVDGYGSRIAVGGRAENTWSFTGTAFTLEGVNTL